MKLNIGILAAAYICLVDTLSLWGLDNDGVRAVFIFFWTVANYSGTHTDIFYTNCRP